MLLFLIAPTLLTRALVAMRTAKLPILARSWGAGQSTPTLPTALRAGQCPTACPSSLRPPWLLMPARARLA